MYPTDTWMHVFMCVTWRIHIYDMTHSYMWHDSFISATRLIHTRDMAHSYMRHDSFTRVTWRIHTCDMTHLHGYTPGFRPYRPQVSSFVSLFCRSLLRVFFAPIARRCPPYIYRSQKRPKKETHKRDLKKKDAVVLATFFPVMGLILWVSFVGLFCGSFPPLSPAGVLPTYIGHQRDLKKRPTKEN